METCETKEPFTIRDMPDEDLRQLARDLYGRRVFTDWHCGCVNDVLMVFMPIGLGGLSDLTSEEFGQIGMIYEYIDKAGPRSINGMPMFFSCNYLSRGDTEKVIAYHEKILEALSEAK